MIVKVATIAFTIGMLCACAPIGKTYVVSIDPELRPYVIDFVNDAASVGKHIEIHALVMQFSNTDFGQTQYGEAIGQCNDEGRGYWDSPVVSIYKPFFEKLDEWTKHGLVYHELGHCVLFRDHRFDWVSMLGTDGLIHYIPASIMSPDLGASADYQMFWSYYVQELFSG